MENSIQEVFNESFGKVRVAVIDGKIYFVGRDVARALGFKNAEGAVKKHVQKQDKIAYRPSEMGGRVRGVPLVTGTFLINESGLWALVMRSRMPRAKELQHWLTSEVIPEIMRTGSYIGKKAPHEPRPALDFSRREKIELLTKLLNYPNLPLNLRNRIINNIVFLLSADFEHILQNYLNQIDE